MKSTAPNTPYGYTIFCDDVRQEAGNKTSLMGVYRGKIIPPMVPASLPKFLLVVHYFERPGESEEPVYLRIYMPGDSDDTPFFSEELQLADARSNPPKPETPDSDPLIAAISHIMIAPFEMKSEGIIRVRAYRGDLEIRLGALKIVARPNEASAPDDESRPKKRTTRKRSQTKKRD